MTQLGFNHGPALRVESNLTPVTVGALTHQSPVEKPADCDGGGEDPGHVADHDAAENLKRDR